MPDFYKVPSWIGFRYGPLDATFEFAGNEVVSSVTISYARNVWAMCMAPQDVEIWAGNAKDNFKLIAKARPVQPEGWVSNRTEGFLVSLPPDSYRYLRLVARPLSNLPEFRDAKNEKGWLMVDEIFFN